ncbi:hypothetical protein GOP47_0000859 [Adiantum capillus-veneris]|uniref:Pectinesterase n=1 Tax=Adiantum capillus-veneris TaxID=13818 RepID=A0A9D4VDS7_ADICA|nr:hypothetical protein GOP47_0000859 [Adiantum capillus-veneris]
MSHDEAFFEDLVEDSAMALPLALALSTHRVLKLVYKSVEWRTGSSSQGILGARAYIRGGLLSLAAFGWNGPQEEEAAAGGGTLLGKLTLVGWIKVKGVFSESFGMRMRGSGSWLALLALLVLSSSSSRLVRADVDDDDASYSSWLDEMDKTSSSEDKQPGKYNTNHDGPPADKTERQNLEVTGGVDAGAAAASAIKTIVVAKDGSGHFTTVQAAVNSIPKSNKQRIIISIKAGIYREKVKVDKPWVTFQGAGPRLTEIQWGDMASTKGPDGNELKTFGSASVAVNGDHFTARDISFRNTAPPPPGGAVGRQAVALRISGDFGAFFNVNFYGAQDTLYDHKGRHYFYRCYIEGSIDFIFGNGRSFYMQCRLHSIANPSGSLTAQKRATTTEETGFSFVKCVVTGSGSIYLGRAWGPASRVVFSLTYFDNIILPQGWFDWADPNRQKTVFYGEYKCFGPGANRDKRVSWSRLLTPKQAKPFLHTGFINGELWLTST